MSRSAAVRSSVRLQRVLRQGVLLHTGADRMTLGLVGVQEEVRCAAVHHLRQLPAEIHGILQAGVEALPSLGRMHMGGVARDQHPASAVGLCLACGVGESGDPGRAVDPVVRPVGEHERLTHMLQGRLPVFELRVGQHDPYPPVLPLADAATWAEAEFRFLVHLYLGDQPAGRRIPPGELDAGGLSDHASSSVAPHEVFRPKRLAIRQLDVDARLVLRETHHLALPDDRHPQLAHPSSQYALEVVLPECKPVVVSGGKIADVQGDAGESLDLHGASLCQEPVRDTALIEHLDGARMQTTGARAGEVLAGAPLEDGDIDSPQGQLGRQHQAGRTSAGDHDGVFSHAPASSTRSPARRCDPPVPSNFPIPPLLTPRAFAVTGRANERLSARIVACGKPPPPL